MARLSSSILGTPFDQIYLIFKNEIRMKLFTLWYRRCLHIALFCVTTSIIHAQVQLLNDEFNDGQTLDNWTNINDEEDNPITQLEAYNINDSTAGHFFIKPFTESWFNEYRGAYIFKYISGDFILTTEVIATGHDGVSLPSSDFSLAGLMIREPVANPDPDLDMITGQQNYVFMAIGQAQNPGWNFEIKNTCQSNSCLNIDNIPTNSSKIRLVRRGNQIIVLSQLQDSTTWQVRNRYDRGCTTCNGCNCNGPFSNTVQIGLVAYTDWPKVSSYSHAFHNTNTLHPDSLVMDPSSGTPFNPDIIANYNFARFDSLVIPAQHVGDNFADPGDISDAELLAFLGFDTEVFCPPSFHTYDPIQGTFIEMRSQQVLTSTSVISQQSQVHFGASSEVSLSDGFEVQSGSILEIDMTGCN